MKLYTQTVCPKCMLVKFSLENAGVLDKVEIINLDEHPEVREELKTNEKSKNYTSLPILEKDGEFIVDQAQIISTVVNG